MRKSKLTRVKIGRKLLADFIELKSMTISKLAATYKIPRSLVLRLMCEAMQEDEFIGVEDEE
jgi:hypothetical protein